MQEDNVQLNSAKAWLLAARPKTLSGAAVPVVIALALAWADASAARPFQWIPAVLCLLFAFIMQIDANFVNDYFDFMKGTDDETRLGPRRACASGWVTASAMRRAMALTTILGCCLGLPLVFYGGWEMLLVGALCVLFCFLYTTHLSYMGLGDLLVLVFFGIVPVCVTYYIQLHSLTCEVFIASLACGFVIDTLLLINNYRDRDNDRRSGKLTLVVRIGWRGGELAYLSAGIVAVFLGLVFLVYGHPYAALLPFVYLLLHIQTYRKMKKISELSHVRVTMNDGSQREGYVTRYWSDGGAFRVMNRKFRMMEGGKEREYTADEVKAVNFVMKNPSSELNEDVVTADVANPSSFRPRKVKRQFVHFECSSPDGEIFWWNAIDSQQMQLGSLTVSTIFGIRLKGDDIIIPFMTGNVISLNAMRICYKKTPRAGMVEYLDKQVLRGGKRLWTSIQQEPSLFLKMIDEYQNSHPTP